MTRCWNELCQNKHIWARNCAISDGLWCDEYMDAKLRNRLKVDTGKPRRYNDRSGWIKYTLNYHHHAKQVMSGDQSSNTMPNESTQSGTMTSGPTSSSR